MKEILQNCQKTYQNKTKDYGTSWRWYRMSTFVDQIFIKAKRVRTIQETGNNYVGEPISGDFKAIINYSLIALIQHKFITKNYQVYELSEEAATAEYNSVVDHLMSILVAKNSDYGAAWEDMSIDSMVDIILAKLARSRKIEMNNQLLESESIENTFIDCANYAMFCLIKLKDEENGKTT